MEDRDVTTPQSSLLDAVRLALAEERGLLIVALYDLTSDELEKLVEAAQLIDTEGCEILEALYASEPKPGHMDRPYGL